jgi:hypothetical protein
MKKTSLCLLALVLSFYALHAQSDDATETVPGRTSFYAELGGPGVLFSANLDKRFKHSNLGLGGRAGIGFVTSSFGDYDPQTGYSNYRTRSVITVPVQLNYIFGKPSSPHTFEVGAGLTYVGKKLNLFEFDNEKGTNLLGSFAFMYRRQPVDGGFMWRIGFTPLVSGGYIQPSGGVGVGYSF